MSWLSDFTGIHIGGDTLDKVWEPIKNPVTEIGLPLIGAVAGAPFGPGGMAAGAGIGRAAGGLVKGEEPVDTLKNSALAAGLGYGAGTGLPTWSPETASMIGLPEVGSATLPEVASTGTVDMYESQPGLYEPYIMGGTPDASIKAMMMPAVSGGSSSILSGLTGAVPTWLLTTMGIGAGLNLLGNYMGAQQQNQNLDTFRQDSTWTPERIANLTSGIESNVNNLYSRKRAKQSKSVAEGLAELGRGGGSAGRAGFELEESLREAKANAMTDAIVKSGMYTPPGLLTGPSAYNNVNPWSLSAREASGMFGNLSNTMMTLGLTRKLYPELFA